MAMNWPSFVVCIQLTKSNYSQHEQEIFQC